MKKLTYLGITLCFLILNNISALAESISEIESNNTLLTAQVHTPIITSGTVNSSIHASITASDLDCYAIVMTSDGICDLTINDAIYPGLPYTLVGKFNYRKGINGSPSVNYNSNISGVSVNAGDTIYITVQSNAMGEIGTYAMIISMYTTTEVPITWTTNSGTGSQTASFVSAFENDFFRITLAAGYQYSINISLTDYYVSSSYTGDGEFEYSIDGILWSNNSYDTSFGPLPLVTNPKMFLVRVHPYNNSINFLGTYKLNISISRVSVDVVEQKVNNDLKIYPNPSDGNFTVDLGENIQGKGTVSITTMNGVVAYNKDLELSGKVHINTNLPTGVYILKVKTDNAVGIKRLIIK